MPTKCLIKPGEYHDSVTLMETARELAQLPGVSDAAIVMATEANKSILREAGLLDMVLGYGAHPNPAGELGPAIRQARRARAAGEGRELVVVASVTGTEGDPQGLGWQVQALEEAGAIVCGCNAAAARVVGFVVG